MIYCLTKDPSRINHQKWFNFLLIFLLALLIGCISILAFVPPIDRDGLVHHLAIPKLYLQHGGIYEIPEMIYSYYPMNLDFLYMICLYFGNDIAPKFIHFAFALLTAFVIYTYLKNKINTSYALVGAFLFLFLPIIIKLSITVYVDLGLVFFTTLSLLQILTWTEKQFQWKYVVKSGICCGLAMGTKYNGLIVFFLLTLFIPFIYSRYGTNQRLKSLTAIWHGGIFVISALIAFSPWMIRNYIWKQNPIYPLYHHLFRSEKELTEKLSDPHENNPYGVLTYRKLVYQETGWQMALLPIRIFFEGEDNNFRRFDGKLNPYLLLFPIVAYFRNRKDTALIRLHKNILLAFAMFFFFFSFFSSVLRIRYISPIIPPLIILTVFGIHHLIDIIQQMERKLDRIIGIMVFGVCFVLCIGINANYLLSQFKYVDPFPYLSGRISRDDYISKYRQEYPAMMYINQNLPLNSVVMFVYLGKRGYYCDRKYLPDESDYFVSLVKNIDTIENICREFRKKGVTHLAVQMDLLYQWKDELFILEEQKRLDLLLSNQLNLLFLKNGVGVFEVKNNC